MRVKLTYFKWSGKYYTNGQYDTKLTSLLDIWNEVVHKQEAGHLPGLAQEAREFLILVRVPTHPHNHPHIFFPCGRKEESHGR